MAIKRVYNIIMYFGLLGTMSMGKFIEMVMGSSVDFQKKIE